MTGRLLLDKASAVDISATSTSTEYSLPELLTLSAIQRNVTNYVDRQTLKPDDDYVLPYQRLWTFDVLVCPLSVTERFLLQSLVCGIVFHRTSLRPPVHL